MLQREKRIPKKLFKELAKNKSYHGEFFSVRVSFLTGKIETPKAVCVVSKKINKRAVARNKIKRQVYSIIIDRLSGSNKKSAIQIFPKKEALLKKYSDLEIDLIKIIEINNLL